MNNTMQDFNEYMHNLEEHIDYEKGVVRVYLPNVEEAEIKQKDYLKQCINAASQLFIHLFNDEDDIYVHVEAKDADLKEDFDKVIENDILGFYGQLLRNQNIKHSIKTYSTFITDDGEEAYTEYVHVDMEDEDGTTKYVETLTNYIMEGKPKDFEILGFIMGKCNSLEGYNTFKEHANIFNLTEIEPPTFAIRDKINIINKTKDIIFTLHNDMIVDVRSLDVNVIQGVKEDFKDNIIE